jgi:hypothetical protein
LSVMSVVCGQAEVPATGRSPIQMCPTECGVSECDRGTRRGLSPTGLSSLKKKRYIYKDALSSVMVVLSLQKQVNYITIPLHFLEQGRIT